MNHMQGWAGNRLGRRRGDVLGGRTSGSTGMPAVVTTDPPCAVSETLHQGS